jgi:hypothetical protein
MRKLIAVIALLTLFAPSVCFGNQDFLSSFREGTYKGHIVSVDPAINDTDATLKLAHDGGKLIATVELADGAEQWVWDAKQLKQVEFDQEHKPVKTYTAKATHSTAGSGQSYSVDCNDAGNCSTDIDARHRWQIEAKGNALTYSVFGVPTDKWGDGQMKAQSRHVMRFTRVDTGIAEQAKTR